MLKPYKLIISLTKVRWVAMDIGTSMISRVCCCCWYVHFMSIMCTDFIVLMHCFTCFIVCVCVCVCQHRAFVFSFWYETWDWFNHRWMLSICYKNIVIISLICTLGLLNFSDIIDWNDSLIFCICSESVLFSVWRTNPATAIWLKW